MTSLAGRVSDVAGAAAVAVNQKWRKYKFSTLSLPKRTLPTPILTWTLESRDSGCVQQSPTTCLGLPDGRDLDEQLVTQFGNPLQSYFFRRRRICRDPGNFLIASRGDGDAATAEVEECTAAIQDYDEQ